MNDKSLFTYKFDWTFKFKPTKDSPDEEKAEFKERSNRP